MRLGACSVQSACADDWKARSTRLARRLRRGSSSYDRNDEAREMIATIPLDRLNPEERALLEPSQEAR